MQGVRPLFQLRGPASCHTLRRLVHVEQAPLFEHRSLAPPFPNGVPRHDHDLQRLVEKYNPLSDSPSVFADLVASALDNVDWHEIAREFLGFSDPDSEPQFLERSI